MRLADCNVIVTGAARGMGAAISTRLATEGANILLVARTMQSLVDLAGSLRSDGRVVEAFSADVTDEDQVKAMVGRAHQIFESRIDVLVNCAGVTGPIETPSWNVTADDFDHVLNANIRGTFLPIKYVLPTMITQNKGKIVNIGGTSGLRGYKYRVAYSSSKWAVRGLTRTIALEVGEYNINVNVVCPGIVNTPRMHTLCEEKARIRGWTYDEVYAEYVEEMALRRVTEPEDVAAAVVFLASDDSRNITGQTITVDGGWDV